MSTRLLVAFLSIALFACAHKPHFTLKGPPIATVTVSKISVVESGLALETKMRCTRELVEHWCPVTNPRCNYRPIVVRHQPATGCAASTNQSVSVRTPWGRVYEGPANAIPIDWRESGIDPLAEDAAQRLVTGWELRSEAMGIDAPYEPSGAEVEALRHAIGAATDTQYDAGKEATPTRLAVTMTNPDTNVVTISVTNTGSVPAYRVVAKLRSSHLPIHNTQVSFGRIDPQQTKTRTRSVVGTQSSDEELMPIVLAEIHAANAFLETVNRRIKLALDTDAGKVQLQCQALDREVAPGQRARVACEIKNGKTTQAEALTYTLSVLGGKPVTVSGPKEIPAGAGVKIELAMQLPGDLKPQQPVQLRATVTGPKLALHSAPISVTVAKLDSGCTAEKLGYEEYRTKHKRLLAARDSGALSQDEFDKYDAELVGCLK